MRKDFTPKFFFQKLAIIYLLVIVEKSDKSFSIKKSKAQKRKANLPKNLFVRRFEGDLSIFWDLSGDLGHFYY